MEEKTCCSCERYKNTARGEEEKKALLTRLNRIAGQLAGVRKMVEDDRYCGDILIQLAAADKAIKSLASVVLEGHMKTCVVEDVRRGDLRSVEEVAELFRKF